MAIRGIQVLVVLVVLSVGYVRVVLEVSAPSDGYKTFSKASLGLLVEGCQEALDVRLVEAPGRCQHGVQGKGGWGLGGQFGWHGKGDPVVHSVGLRMTGKGQKCR